MQSWEDARGEYRQHLSERGRIVQLERTRLSADILEIYARPPTARSLRPAALQVFSLTTPPDLTWLSVRPVMVPADLRITEDDVHQPSDGLRCEGRDETGPDTSWSSRLLTPSAAPNRARDHRHQA